MSDAPEPSSASAEGGRLESAAYPPLVRTLAVVIVLDVLVLGLWALPSLREAQWSAGGLFLMGVAGLCIACVGYWVVYSRTTLEGDLLVQTWLWNKRVEAGQVAQLKLVHWRWLQRLVAPRLLVKRRNGSIAWFYSADALLLTEFAQRVAARSLPAAHDTPRT
ncbi:MAG: hypothetical protein EOO22_04030 [Comamonadaceae bacterium]|nr:MAG: hypothetical protein EOO22_04030 [Comamonadaceae bacterium]